MIRILKYTLLFYTLTGPYLAIGQPTGAPGLQELIDSALTRDHGLAEKTLELEAAAIDLQQLKEIYLPHAGLSGKYAFLANSVNIGLPATTLSQINVTLPEISSGFSSNAHLAKADLGISAVLYTGGKVPALKKALNQKNKAQTALIEKDRQQIIADVYKAYDQLALLQQVKAVLDESEKRLNINSKTADKAFEYGLITKYEKQKIEVAHAQLSAKKQLYEGQRNLLLHQMAMYSGIDMDRLSLIANQLTPALHTASGQGIETRPEVSALNAAIAAREYQVKAAQTWWLPKVQAATSIGYLNLFNANIYGKTELPGNLGKVHLKTDKLEVVPNFNIGVGFQWDLFDGFKGKRETQQARIAVHIAEHQKEEAIEKLQLNLVKTRTDFDNANADITVKQKQVETAENALLQAGKEFKTGLIKPADLIGAENDYQTAALEYYQAVFNQRRSVAELLKATGSLTPQSLQ